MMKNLIIIISTLFLLLACEKPVIEKTVQEIELYEQIWETRYHPETFVLHTDPYIFKELIIAGQRSTFEKTLDYNIAAFNKESGKFLWGWNHPKSSTVILDLYGQDNLLFIRARHSIFVFDIEEKSVLWEIEYSDELQSIGKPLMVEDKLYLTLTNRAKLTNKKATEVRKYDLFTGEFETLYTEIIDDIKPYRPFIGNITLFENSEGEKLGVFEVRYIADDVSPRETLPDLVCIDMESGEILWRQTDYNELASGNNTIKYYNGKLYNTGDWSLYAFDPETGKELNRWQFWESHPLGSFNNADFTIVNDVVYTLDDLGYLNGINTVTEDFEFSYKTGAANTQSPPMVRNDLIMYSSFGHQAVEIFDTKKHAFVHKENQRAWGEAIIYDEETDMYFTTTSEMIHAFRINDQ